MRAIVALGSNLGDGADNLHRATHLLAEHVGRIVAESPMYSTEPWKFDSTNTFTNSVLLIDTDLTPQQLLDAAQHIERQMGRTAKSHNGVYADRLIDIDLIDCDGRVLHTDILTLSHPLMHRRAFVLQPLCDVWPQWRHPVLHHTATELWHALLPPPDACKC